ncbi:helix-turn-helix domain-containing protein [Allorhodopirellula solitaria]|uniref:Helix-turn-helix domain protein n=1 Tax=Allorhodopirellula solitaria TaxID=2527987 RepID=A0A5C5YE41_9BACT|nr:helix-turn-helix domain-containing protein [Allorhodopirellula solitaria]TWT73304.1 hypothetical protein CA85_17720 [Allorhodopirellula solitaria]
MSSLFLQGIAPDELIDAIAAAVLDQIRPALSESSAPLLVDRDEMARLASISPPMVDKLRAAGTIPSVLAGRRRLYRPDAVIEALTAATRNEKGGAING